jgi:hypothetical protein
MTYEAGNHPAPLKKVQSSLGTVEKYGLDTFISLEAIANADLNAALWAFRAVYPEQRLISSKAARRYAGVVFRAARGVILHNEGLVQDAEPIRKLAAVADDYLIGLCDKKFLEAKSKEAYRYAATADPDILRWLAYLASFALGPKPERRGPDMLEAALQTNPYDSKQEPMQHRRYHNAMSAALRTKLLEVLEPRDEAIGPVARGFDGSFTVRPKRPNEGSNVRAYRHKTTIKNMLMQ